MPEKTEKTARGPRALKIEDAKTFRLRITELKKSWGADVCFTLTAGQLEAMKDDWERNPNIVLPPTLATLEAYAKDALMLRVAGACASYEESARDRELQAAREREKELLAKQEELAAELGEARRQITEFGGTPIPLEPASPFDFDPAAAALEGRQ